MTRIVVSRQQEVSLSPQQVETVRCLLGDVAVVSRSSVVVLRQPDATSRQLELVGYVTTPDVPFVGADFEIPLRKSFDSWGAIDPTETWGMMSDAPCGAGQYYGPAEQAFVDWVRQKAWFNVETDQGPHLIVLLRGDDIAYEFRDVALAWFVAQLFLAGRSHTEQLTRFKQLADELEPLAAASDNDAFHAGAALLLASRFGLGWQRVWLFEESAKSDSTITFECLAALGETDSARWGAAVDYATSTFPSMSEELTGFLAARLYRHDHLYVASCEATRLMLQLSTDDVNSIFAKPPASGAEQHALALLDESIAPVAAGFTETIRSHFQLQGQVYAPGGRWLQAPFWIGSRRALALITQPYESGMGEPSRILTTVLLQQLGRLSANRQLGTPALTVDDLDAKSEEDLVRDLEEYFDQRRRAMPSTGRT